MLFSLKEFLFTIVLLSIFSFFVSPAFAQSTPPATQNFYTGKVVSIPKEGYRTIEGQQTAYQIVNVFVQSGPDQGKTITINRGGGRTSILASQEVSVGSTVILEHMNDANGKVSYDIYDTYRIPMIAYIFLAFALLILLVAGFKGIGSLLGLFISLVIILGFIVPQILQGANPLVVSIIGSLIILFVTTYLAHGVSKQTTVALLSTFIALVFSVVLSYLFVHLTHLTGTNDETMTLQFGQTGKINLQGLLLAGIIIGTLGALNDITTTQAATVFSFAREHVGASFKKLFSIGFEIGREHIVSMVNTIVLAYAGSALVIFLFFVFNPQHMPWWVILNNEDISDEIVRTLAGSMGLVLVVPIVTVFAALVSDAKVTEFFSDVWSSLFG